MNDVGASSAETHISGAAPAQSEPAARADIPKPLGLWLRSLIALGALLGLMLVMPSVPPFKMLEAWIADLELALLAPTAPPHPRLVVLDINESVVAKMARRSPIDRQFLAQVISAAAAYEPAAIGVDILIDQPTDPASDAALAGALRAAKVPVVLAWAETASAPNAIAARQEGELRAFFERLAGSNVVPGVVNLLPDSDGVIRRLVLRTAAGTARDGFVLALAKATGTAAPEGLERKLAYYGHPTATSEPFNIIPADAVAAQTAGADAFLRPAIAGRVVLIGASLADTDRHRTPFAMDPLSGAANAPGMLIHAHALAQLMDGRDVPETPRWAAALLTLIAVALGFQIGRWDAPSAHRLLSALAALLVLITVVGLVFRFGNIAGAGPGPSLPLATTMVALLIATALGNDHERRRIAADRRLIRSVLARYVPEAAIEPQLQHPENVGTSSVRQEMSFVFSDIAGFTTLCESAPPHLLVPMLNVYLNAMSEVVNAHGGTVGGFIGDAVVAYWGAPVADAEHAQHALTAAIAMSKTSQTQREEARKRGLDFGRTRIGVHTGVASLGSFGGAGHLEYMAHGDVVNTSSRLEGVNKFLGTNIAVSGATAARVTVTKLRPAAEVVFKGKTEALPVLEPVDDMPTAQLAPYLEAYELMREGSPQALEIFEQFHRAWPHDKLAQFHLKRLRKGEIGSKLKLKRK
jgi:adenylate cyclase